MQWKLKTFDLTVLDSIADTSESSLSWYISCTALCLFLPVYFGTGLLWLLPTLLKWCCCAHIMCSFPQMLDICEVHALYHSICISVCGFLYIFGMLLSSPLCCLFHHIQFSVFFSYVKHGLCTVLTSTILFKSGPAYLLLH